MSPLADLIRREAGGDGCVEQVVFGTSDCDAVAERLTALAGHALGEPVVDALFYRSSVGCVAALAGEGGSAVVVKAHQASRSLASLLAVAEVQRVLARRGFPCPSPVHPPFPLGPGLGHATFESWLPDPGQGPITQPMLRVSATALARLASLTDGLEDLGAALGAPQPAPGSLYPPPHSPLFDFAATADGAEWIDRIAAEAREVIDRDGAAPRVVHGDWSASNVRFSEAKLLAAYDWDSLIFAPLSRAVGVAAATWSARGEAADGIAPPSSEIRLYVETFESASQPFGEVERRAAYANALYCLAYTARCEHALDPAELVRSRARPRLRADGADLLRK